MTDEQKTKGERVILRKCMGITARVEDSAKREFGVQWFRPKLEDQLRLLTLEHWEEKYRVKLEWMLQQLIPYWRERYTKFRKGTGLGVSIATLTGRKSEERLRQRILETWPEGEQIESWRQRERERQVAAVLDHGNGREDWEDLKASLQKYQRRMASAREERRRLARELSRRNYRNNPWRDEQRRRDECGNDKEAGG